MVQTESAKILLGRYLEAHYEQAWEAKKVGKPVCWVSSNFPLEFLETMDLTVVYPENQSTSISAKHESMEMISLAEQLGYSNDLCGYARVNFGFLENGGCDSQNMPMPDVVICSNNICHQLVKWFENVAKICDVPLIMFDIPFNTEYDVTPSRIAYMRDQIPYIVDQLEQLTDKMFDWKKFEKVCAIANEAGTQWKRASRYFEGNPSPHNGF